MEAYKVWHVFHQGFPRLSKHTLGEKIDRLFTELLESLFLASYAAGNEKAAHIMAASAKLDLLKYFLHIAWELKCLNHKQYAAMTPPLAEVGKMIGGWMKYAERKTPLV
jgi:hypothetical protein